MQKRNVLFPVTLTVLSLIGIVDASYLSYARFTNTEIVCDAIQGLNGCNIVAASPYSVLFGIIPLAYLGLAFYLLLFVLAIISFTNQGAQVKKVFLAITGLAFLSSAYFIYLQAFVIGAFCMYCVLSAVTSTLFFVLSLTWYFLGRIDDAIGVPEEVPLEEPHIE